MKSRVLHGVLVALLLVASGAAFQAPQRPGSSVFRGGVDVVVLQVTVLDRSRRFVPDLRAEDFTVLENGRPQQLAFFSQSRTPVALSLLLDTSTSMDRMLNVAQDAAVTFARRLEPDDIAQVIAFSHRVELIQPFTGVQRDLEAAIRRTRAGGSTALYTAVYVALSELRTLQRSASSGIRRHAIVLLSDGEDTSSLVSFEQVMDLAQRLDVAIYSIGLRFSSPDRGHTRFDEPTFVLRQFAQATGGRAFFAQHPEELSQVYAQIAEELSNQYTLAYVPATAGADKQWRAIAVRIRRPEYVAATRPGYFATR